MAKIVITLDLDVDQTSVKIDGMPGHGGIYQADSYRVRKYESAQKVIGRWASINDGYEDAKTDHAAFMDKVAKTYGSRVALAIAQLMVAEFTGTAEQDAEWGRSMDEAW